MEPNTFVFSNHSVSVIKINYWKLLNFIVELERFENAKVFRPNFGKLSIKHSVEPHLNQQPDSPPNRVYSNSEIELSSIWAQSKSTCSWSPPNNYDPTIPIDSHWFNTF